MLPPCEKESPTIKPHPLPPPHCDGEGETEPGGSVACGTWLPLSAPERDVGAADVRAAQRLGGEVRRYTSAIAGMTFSENRVIASWSVQSGIRKIRYSMPAFAYRCISSISWSGVPIEAPRRGM